MNEFVFEVTDSSFETEVLRSERPVLVDFWAPWCGPCRFLGPIVDAVAVQYRDVTRVANINVDDNVSISQRYGIKGIPTLILFRDGKEAGRIVGTTSEKQIVEMIDRNSKDPVAAYVM